MYQLSFNYVLYAMSRNRGVVDEILFILLKHYSAYAIIRAVGKNMSTNIFTVQNNTSQLYDGVNIKNIRNDGKLLHLTKL